MSRIRAATLLAAAALATGAVARADVVHLKNGRTMEGEVVRRTAEAIHLEVRGGKMVLPAAMVERVEERMSPEQEFGARARRTDMSDPRAIDRLALWASSRGLGDRARNLTELARGLRLERKVEAARARGQAGAFVDVYYWAESQGLSPELRGWLLEQARAIDPADPAVRSVEQRRARRVAAERQEAARREAETRAAVERAERARIERLEERLARQQERIEELEQGSSALSDRRRVIRRRRRGRRDPDAGILSTGSDVGRGLIRRRSPLEPRPGVLGEGRGARPGHRRPGAGRHHRGHGGGPPPADAAEPATPPAPSGTHGGPSVPIRGAR